MNALTQAPTPQPATRGDRRRALWLARAQDAIRQGWTEEQFVSFTEAASQYDACRAYREAMRETETRQAFIAEFTNIN